MVNVTISPEEMLKYAQELEKQASGLRHKARMQLAVLRSTQALCLVPDGHPVELCFGFLDVVEPFTVTAGFARGVLNSIGEGAK